MKDKSISLTVSGQTWICPKTDKRNYREIYFFGKIKTTGRLKNWMAAGWKPSGGSGFFLIF
jgi:hypothetical protein